MPKTHMPKMPQTNTAAIPIPVGKSQERSGPVDAACIGPVDKRKEGRWIETREKATQKHDNTGLFVRRKSEPSELPFPRAEHEKRPARIIH